MGLQELGRALTPAARVAWEARLAGLVGERIVGARYVELDSRDPQRSTSDGDPGDEPAWAGPGFHALDYGLELSFDSGLAWWFSWQPPGADGESLVAGAGTSLTDRIPSARVWDVTAVDPWATLIGVPITATEILWDHWPAGSSGALTANPEFWCQIAYILKFENGTEIVITFGERNATTGGLQAAADNLAIFTSRDAATHAGSRVPPTNR